jgi:hypothetical protein
MLRRPLSLGREHPMRILSNPDKFRIGHRCRADWAIAAGLVAKQNLWRTAWTPTYQSKAEEGLSLAAQPTPNSIYHTCGLVNFASTITDSKD